MVVWLLKTNLKVMSGVLLSVEKPNTSTTLPFSHSGGGVGTADGQQVCLGLQCNTMRAEDGRWPAAPRQAQVSNVGLHSSNLPSAKPAGMFPN
jgi:hypothetical protein